MLYTHQRVLAQWLVDAIDSCRSSVTKNLLRVLHDRLRASDVSCGDVLSCIYQVLNIHRWGRRYSE